MPPNVMASRPMLADARRSPELRLCEALVEGTLAKLAPAAQQRLRAVLLTGSVARGEGTWLAAGDTIRLLGDADVLLVLEPGCPLPTFAEVAAIESYIAACLEDDGVLAVVSVNAVHPSYLRRLPPHIFSYELRHAGQCVWGEPAILNLIPAYPRQALSREDAWRLLANRLVEALPAAWGHGADTRGEAPPDGMAALYPWVKLHLDMATSYLVFCGEYEPTYAARALRLYDHWTHASPDAPLVASDFAERVVACTDWKLAPKMAVRPGTASALCAKALADARALWLWEMEQMTGAPASAMSRHELWERWLRSRSWVSRGRGWASAARRLGPGSVRLWPRWARLCLRATPRHWIYEAAGEVVFGLNEPGRLKATPGGNLCFDVSALSARLPLPAAGGETHAETGMEALLQQLEDNYHRLAQTTRT